MTDLPVRVIGVHDLGQSFNERMFTGRTSSWLREDADNRPWRTWRVPVVSRPGQEVRWRDVIILDENNEFVAVQNLTEETLSSGPNRDKLKSVLFAAATITDTDIDGIPDRWEFRQFGGIETGAGTRLSTGQTALLAYAMSQPPSDYRSERDVRVALVEDGGGRFLQLRFRRRLGGEGRRLLYEPQVSNDGVEWSGGELIWNEESAVNPWDGSGTEVVTVRTPAPAGAGAVLLARLRVESPL